MSQNLEKARETNDRVQRLLVEQKARLETIMDNITGGVLTLDGGGRLQSWNQNAGKILDLPLVNLHKTPLPETVSRRIDAGCHYRLEALAELYTPDLSIIIVQEDGSVAQVRVAERDRNVRHEGGEKDDRRHQRRQNKIFRHKITVLSSVCGHDSSFGSSGFSRSLLSCTSSSV